MPINLDSCQRMYNACVQIYNVTRYVGLISC